MIQKYKQVKLNIPVDIKEKLESKASVFGLTLAGYIKYLLIKDMELELQKQALRKK